MASRDDEPTTGDGRPPDSEDSHQLPDGVLADLDSAAVAALDQDRGTMEADCTDVRCLVAEVRRLRSDDWAVRAMDEIDREVSIGLDATDRARVMAIVRKHRDRDGMRYR
jgi:hypothetical protein